jgi:hypothetical protein
MSLVFKSCIFISVLSISSLALSQTEQNVRTTIFSDSWPDSRFTIGNDGTITDAKTDLMWKQCAEGANWTDNMCEGDRVFVNWEDAHDIARQSEYAGYNNWRVPNIKELNSLTAHGRVFPAMNVNAFPILKVGTLQITPNYLSSSRTAEFDSDQGVYTSKSVYYWRSSNGEVSKTSITSDPADFKIQLLLVRDR